MLIILQAAVLSVNAWFRHPSEKAVQGCIIWNT